MAVGEEWKPKHSVLPGPTWIAAAGQFVGYAVGQMATSATGQAYAASRGLLPETVAHHFEGQPVTELAVAPLPQDKPEQMRAYARGVMAAMVRMDLTRRMGDMRSRLQRMDPADPDFAATNVEMARLVTRLRTFTEQDQ